MTAALASDGSSFRARTTTSATIDSVSFDGQKWLAFDEMGTPYAYDPSTQTSAAMAASSVTVVSNALRLRRFRVGVATPDAFARHYNECVPTLEEELDVWGEYHGHRHEMRYRLVADHGGFLYDADYYGDFPQIDTAASSAE